MCTGVYAELGNMEILRLIPLLGFLWWSIVTCLELSLLYLEFPMFTPRRVNLGELIPSPGGGAKVPIYVRNVNGAGKGPKSRVSPSTESCVLRLVGWGHGWRLQGEVREISQAESFSGYSV